jgi:hypothetical protein
MILATARSASSPASAFPPSATVPGSRSTRRERGAGMVYAKFRAQRLGFRLELSCKCVEACLRASMPQKTRVGTEVATEGSSRAHSDSKLEVRHVRL